MARLGGSGDSGQGPAGAAAAVRGAPGMEWDLDVDAFLDDYLKELGPEAHGTDHFGNFGIDFQPPSGAAPPLTLGAWGPLAPTPPAAAPADSTHQQAPTLLTSQLQHQVLDSHKAAPAAAEQPVRVTRGRKSGAVAASRAKLSAATTATTGTATTTSVGGGSGGSRGAGSARGGGGRETKKEAEMKRHLALQEKNRRAQRRFLERQKQRVTELEEQVAQLEAQLAAAGVVGGAGAAAHPPPAHAAADDSDMMQHDAGMKAEPPSSPRAVVGVQGPSSSSAPASEDGQPLDPATAAACAESLMLTLREGHPVLLTGRELADMMPAELARHYKAYVNELAGILVESDNPGSQTTQERVRRLVEEVCLLSTRAGLCNPAGSKHFNLTKVDDVSGQPADARVPQIARALNICQQQRRQLGHLRAIFLQRLAAICAERQEINQQLAGSVPGGTGARAMCSRYLAAHDAAARLRASLREEHMLGLDLASTIYKHVLSCQQVAQFMIQSYPYTPDCLALCTWVAAEDGDAAALSMLAAEAQSKQAAAAAAAAAMGTGPQSSSGGSGSGTPHTGAPGSSTFVPTAFASAQAAGDMYGQQSMMPAGMAAAFNPATALMHPPSGGATDDFNNNNNLLGQGWPSGSGSSAQSGRMHVHMALGRGASGCLPMPAPQLGLSLLTGAGSGGPAGMLLGGELLGSLPMPSHVAEMSSAGTSM